MILAVGSWKGKYKKGKIRNMIFFISKTTVNFYILEATGPRIKQKRFRIRILSGYQRYRYQFKNGCEVYWGPNELPKELFKSIWRVHPIFQNLRVS